MLSLRPVELNDAPLLYRWRLDEDARLNSQTKHIFRGDTHVGWLCEELARECPMWIGMNFRVPVGVIIFSKHTWKRPDGSDPELRYDEPNYIVSLNVAAPVRKKGYGTDLLRQGLAYLPDSRPCYAVIKTSNEASVKIFSRAGFTLFEDNGEFARYRWSPTL